MDRAGEQHANQAPINGEFLKSNYPCYSACPVHTEAGQYVHMIAQGRYAEAYRLARLPNPFASICGRICAAPCETACRRGDIDQPVSIRALKRFVCEQYGVESLMDVDKIGAVLRPGHKPKSQQVAIIGAGPAGLAAAHDLSLLGYPVTVFEAQDVAGGMLRLGIPEYRLPRELIRMEVNAILNLGVQLELGKRLGRDFSLSDLRENGYEAIFIAIGAQRSRDLAIEGVELDGVLRGIDFLLNINLGYKVELAEKIIVIGGGNVAFDVARTAARQTPVEEMASSITEALDVARSAVRFGAREVHMVCLESWAEMPAAEEEIAEALEENIHIRPGLGPHRIVGENGKVTGLETLDCTAVFDADGRFNPQFAQGTERIWPAGSIIMAIGQAANLDFIQPSDGITITARNTIQIEPGTLATTAPGIYAGGDVAFGPRIAIDAVADGRKVAAAIDAYLNPDVAPVKKIQVAVHNSYDYNQFTGFEMVPRQPVPALKIDRRVGIAQVELGYSEADAQLEAQRCLRCWVNTVFDGSEERGTECILCGGCVDICPENCIDLVHYNRVSLDEITLESLSLSSECLVMGRSVDDSRQYGAVMIKDEAVCIRCGYCAKRCPTGCITMQEWTMLEEVSYA